MRILALSDTHNLHYPLDQMPDADLVVHAGDACIKGRPEELDRFNAWVEAVSARYECLLYVPGNHDRMFNGPDVDWECRLQIPRARVLINEWYNFHGMSIFGSPVTKPVRSPWYYYYDEAPRAAFWQKMMKAATPDLLITHAPPKGILDLMCDKFEVGLDDIDRHMGCRHLREYVEANPPALHLFGHLHEGHGRHKMGPTTFLNCSIRDEKYNTPFGPWLITMEQEGNRWMCTNIEQIIAPTLTHEERFGATFAYIPGKT